MLASPKTLGVSLGVSLAHMANQKPQEATRLQPQPMPKPPKVDMEKVSATERKEAEELALKVTQTANFGAHHAPPSGSQRNGYRSPSGWRG